MHAQYCKLERIKQGYNTANAAQAYKLFKTGNVQESLILTFHSKGEIFTLFLSNKSLKKS